MLSTAILRTGLRHPIRLLLSVLCLSLVLAMPALGQSEDEAAADEAESAEAMAAPRRNEAAG